MASNVRIGFVLLGVSVAVASLSLAATVVQTGLLGRRARLHTPHDSPARAVRHVELTADIR